jgi:hypothetical protein
MGERAGEDFLGAFKDIVFIVGGVEHYVPDAAVEAALKEVGITPIIGPRLHFNGRPWKARRSASNRRTWMDTNDEMAGRPLRR